MTRHLLALALIGLASALPFSPRSYEYVYRGEVRAGMPEIRQQFAGTAMTASVKLTLASPTRADVQISNVRVGSVNSMVSPSEGAMITPADAEALQAPFSVFFSGRKEKLMTPRNEITWVKNVKKSIASALRIPFVLTSPPSSIVNMLENRIEVQSEAPKVFSRLEDSIHGKCMHTYTLTKAAPVPSMRLRRLEEDADVSKGSAYRLVKSIDFSDCSDRVVYRKSSHENYLLASTSEKQGWHSQSSNAEYILFGEPKGALSTRIELAVIEGSVSVNPMGFESEKLMIISNQTLSLKSAATRKYVSQPKDTLLEEPWSFELASETNLASMKSGDSMPIIFEKYLTGFMLTEEKRHELKSQIIYLMKEITKKVMMKNVVNEGSLKGTTDGEVLEKISRVETLLHTLEETDIENIYRYLVENSSMSLKEKELLRLVALSVLTTSGSGPSMKVLLNLIKNKKVSQYEIAQLFTTMKPNVMNPAVTTELIEYALSVPETESIILQSSVFTSVSSIIGRVCIKNKHQSLTLPENIRDKFVCNNEAVYQKYIPHIRNRLMKTSRRDLRAVYVHALSMIGEESSMKTLAEIAQGSYFRDETTLRLLAIKGLAAFRMNESYSFVHDTLLSISETQIEKPSIRETAIYSLFTFPQNASTWKRMAASTWREPSKRVSSFIYTALKSISQLKNLKLAKKINMARLALPLAKPQTTSENFLNTYAVSSNFDSTSDVGYKFAAMMTSESVPNSFMVYLKQMIRDIKVPLVKVDATGKGIALFIKSMLHSRENFKQVTESWAHSDEDSQFFGNINIMNSLDIFLPVTKEYLRESFEPSKNYLAFLHDKMSKNNVMQLFSHVKLLDIIEIKPSDIGLPIISKVARPSLMYSEMSGNAEVEGSKFSVGGVVRSKYAVRTIREMKVLVPWQNVSISAGVDIENSIDVPVKFSVSAELSSPAARIPSVEDAKSLKFELAIDDHTGSVPLYVRKTLPYTAVQSMLLSRTVRPQMVKRINTFKAEPIYRSNVPVVGSETGFDVSIEYEGDMPLMSHFEKAYESLKSWSSLQHSFLGISPRQSQIAVIFNTKSPQMKKIEGTVNYVQLKNSMARNMAMDSTPVIEDLSVEDTLPQRIGKLIRSSSVIRPSGMISASVNLIGSEAPIKYEVVSVMYPHSTADHNQTTPANKFMTQLNVMRSRFPGEPQSQQWCLTASMKTPKIYLSQSLFELLRNDSELVLQSDVYSGEKCSSSSRSMQMELAVRLGAEQRQWLQNALVQSGESVHQRMKVYQGMEPFPKAGVFSTNVRFHSGLKPSLRNATQRAVQMVRGSVFPARSSNLSKICTFIHVPEMGDVTICCDTQEEFATQKWEKCDIFAQSSENVYQNMKIKLPALVEYFRPQASLGYSNVSKMQGHATVAEIIRQPLSKTCRLFDSTLEMFNHKKINLPAISDFSSLSMYQSTKKGWALYWRPQMMKSGRFHQQLLLFTAEGMAVELESDQPIRVNYTRITDEVKVYKNSKGEVIAIIHQDSVEKRVELPRRLLLKLSGDGSTVMIEVPSALMPEMSGMCGGPSRVPIDPRGCHYETSQGDLYAAAWRDTSSRVPSSSPSPKTAEILRRLRQFQSTCPKSLHEQASVRLNRDF